LAKPGSWCTPKEVPTSVTELPDNRIGGPPPPDSPPDWWVYRGTGRPVHDGRLAGRPPGPPPSPASAEAGERLASDG